MPSAFFQAWRFLLASYLLCHLHYCNSAVPADTDSSSYLTTLLRESSYRNGLSGTSLALVGANHMPDIHFDSLRAIGVTIFSYELDERTGSISHSARRSPDSLGGEVTTEGDIHNLSADFLCLTDAVQVRGDLLALLVGLRADQRIVLLSSVAGGQGGSSELVKSLESRGLKPLFLRVGTILKRGSSGVATPSSPLLDELVCEAMTLGVLDVHSVRHYPSDTYHFFTHEEDALLALLSLLVAPLQIHTGAKDFLPPTLCLRTALLFNELAAHTASPVLFHHPPLANMSSEDRSLVQNNIRFGQEVCSSTGRSSVISVSTPTATRQRASFSNETLELILKATLARYLENDLLSCSSSAVEMHKKRQEIGWIEKQVNSLVDQNFHLVLLHSDSSRGTMTKVDTVMRLGGSLISQGEYVSGSCELLALSPTGSARVAVVVIGDSLDRQELEADVECSCQAERESVVLVLWSEGSPQALLHVGPEGVASHFDMENTQQRHVPFISHNVPPRRSKKDIGKESAFVGGREPLHFRMSGRGPQRGAARSRTVLLTHMRNEELLLPQWIRHYSPHFDFALLLDYNSSDSSLDIILREAPASWSVVQSAYAQFECKQADEELMALEAGFPEDWKVVLTLTEFLVLPSLRRTLLLPQFSSTTLVRFPSYLMVGEEEEVLPYQSHSSLLLQRRHFGIDPEQPKGWLGLTIYSRFMHRRLTERTHYGSGRHFMHHDGQLLTDELIARMERDGGGESGIFFRSMEKEGFITKYKWTPWPETVPRNAQIYPRISSLDRAVGTPHVYSGKGELDARRAYIFRNWFVESFQSIGTRADRLTDLRVNMHRIWLETTREVPLFHDNSNFLKNVSDWFELSVVIDEAVHTVRLRMSDLLYASPSDSDPLAKDIKEFCRRHVVEGGESCEISVAAFAYRWVMEANLY